MADVPVGEKKKNSLLIVDDERENLKILHYILGSEYTIYTATDGLSAIDKAREYMPDLILLDIIMDGMNGYETLAEIKKCDKIGKIPVIFISKLSSPRDEEKGLALDAADYIIKPFREMIVQLRIRNQMQIINQLRTIENLSKIDQLTNLPNRRSFDGRVLMEWKQAIREQTIISIFMMDVDKFKTFNDLHGHQHGDVVLQTISKIFMQSFNRAGDFAARWGGEEFVALLPNTPLEGALEVAERVRAEVEKAEIPCKDGTITKVTISVGVNSQLPKLDSSIETFISKADMALYAAKEAGRNKVAHALL